MIKNLNFEIAIKRPLYEVGHEGLVDFSFAGYHASAKDTPRLYGLQNFNVTSFGATGDGITDDTQAVQDAMDMARVNGGVVYFPEGTYVITEVIQINRSNIQIRGAGPEQTIIKLPYSLSDVEGENNAWSWSGAFFHVKPDDIAEVTNLGTVSSSLNVGSRTLPVNWASSDRPEAGEWIQLEWHNDMGSDTLLDNLYGGVVSSSDFGTYIQDSDASKVREWVQVTSVKGNVVKIAKSIRTDIRPEWNVSLTRKPHLTEVGIEELSFEFPETDYPGHLDEKGYNAIYVQNLINGWVRNVHTLNADSGIILHTIRFVTVRDILIQGRKMHHPLLMSWSTDCLFDSWRIEVPQIHGTSISWAAHRNVYSRGWGENLSMDAHRALNFENLHTQITIKHTGDPVNPLKSSGSSNKGLHSARKNVYWNIYNDFQSGSSAVEFGPYTHWPKGFFIGWRGNRSLVLSPASGRDQTIDSLNSSPIVPNLFFHQLKLRLGYVPYWLKNPRPRLKLAQFVYLSR